MYYTCMLSQSKKCFMIRNSESSNIKQDHASRCQASTLKCQNE